MGYNVRPPYQSYGASVGREIANKERKGFSASMQRLNETLQPYALQRKKQRFSEQMQEDAQKHAFDLAEKRYQNQRDLTEFRMSEELKNIEKQREQKKAWMGETQASIKRAMEELGKTPEEIAAMSGAELSQSAGVPLDEAEAFVKSGRAAQAHVAGRDKAAREAKTAKLQLQDEVIALQQRKAAYATEVAERASYPLSQRLSDQAEKRDRQQKVEEAESKERIRKLNNAAKVEDRERRLHDLKMANEGLKQKLTNLEIDEAEKAAIIGAHDVATKRRFDLIQNYDSDIESLENAIRDSEDDEDGWMSEKKRGFILKAMTTMEARNREARAVGAPILYWNEELNIAMLDANRTQEHFDNEAGIAEMAKKLTPEALTTALLWELPYESIDSSFLTMLPNALDLAKTEPLYTVRALRSYKLLKDEIIEKRRRAAAAGKAREAPTTDAENTGEPPPPAPEPDLEYLSY